MCIILEATCTLSCHVLLISTSYVLLKVEVAICSRDVFYVIIHDYVVPVQGGWTSWVNKSPCSSLCVDGTQTRVRNCTRPIPEYGGEDCIGESNDTIECGANSCGNIYI